MFGLEKKKKVVEDKFVVTIDELKAKYTKYGLQITRIVNLVDTLSPALRKELIITMRKAIK